MALIAAKAAFMPLALDLAAADVFALPKSAVSRALLYLMFSVLALYALRHPRELRWSRLLIPLAAYVVIAVLATAFAVHPQTSLFGAPRRFLGLTSVLDGVVLLLAAAVFVRTSANLVWIAYSALAAASVALGYGLLQSAKLDPVRWVDPMVSGTIGNSGAFAGYAVLTTAVTLSLLVLGWEALRRWERGALTALGLVSLGVTLVVGARSPTLALLAAVVTIAAVAWRAQPRSLGLLPGRSLLAIAMLVLFGLAITVPFTNAGVRLARLLQGGDLSTAERAVIYATSLDAIRSRPVLGAGPDGFIAVFLALRSPDSVRIPGVAEIQSSTHSWVLHHGVGTGLAGLLAISGLVALALVESWRRARRPEGRAAAVAAIALVTFLAQGAFNVTHVATEWIFWLSLGIVAAPGAQPADALEDRRKTRSGAVDLVPAIVALAIGAVIAFSVTNSVVASHAVRSSAAARTAGNVLLAEHLAESAVRADPGRADHWNALGLAREPRSLEAAAQAFAKAAELAPYESAYLLNRARAEALLAERAPRYRELALDDVRRSLEVDAHGLSTLRRSAEILTLLGEAREAVPLIERLLTFAPDTAVYYDLASRVYEAAGDRRRAAEMLEEYVRRIAGAGAPSPELRLRLARLYEAAGDGERSRSIYAPPRAVSVERCVRTGDPAPSTRCLRVWFTAETLLALQQARSDAVNRTQNYAIDDGPLPEGTLIIYDGGTGSATILLPQDAPAPLAGARLSIRDVADALGRVLVPNPTYLSVP